MKSLTDLNYYEILQIPVNATNREIEQAYEDALAMYGENALATYSLFPNADRDALLQRIENAYSTLIEESKRAAYDSELVDSGQITEPALQEDSPPVLPPSKQPIRSSDAYWSEMIHAIDNYGKKFDHQKLGRQEIQNHLKFLHIQEKVHKKKDLSEIGPELQTMLTHIEKSSLRMRRNISAIILLYTVFAITSFVILAITNAFMLPAFNIPYSILLMGLVGCIASMYIKLPNIRSGKPLRYDPIIWFIICPLIAVILAGISYGVLQMFISFIPIEQSDDSWLFRIVAFLIGFVNWVYIYDWLRGEPANRDYHKRNHQSKISR